MTHKTLDRCKETTSTTGLGTLTLTGPAAGHIAMADATDGLTANGDTSWFVAENGTEWEMFLGTRVDSTHLARTTFIKSSTGSSINFTAPPVVFSTVPSEKLAAVGPSFSAYMATSAQSLTSATWTKAQLNAEAFDNGNCFDSTTNYRFQPNVAGYYQVSFQAYISGATLAVAETALYKNGAAAVFGTYVAAASDMTVSSGSKLIYMNGATDYLELYVWGTGTTVIVNFGDAGTFMTAHFVRAA